MYRDIAKLVLYRDLGEDSILMKLSGIFEDFDLKRCENAELCARIYDQIKRLLDLATSYGFDKNLRDRERTWNRLFLNYQQLQVYWQEGENVQ